MEAFVEWLCDCKCAGIVRSGPVATTFGKDWDYAVAFARHGDHAEIKALAKPFRMPRWLKWLEWLLTVAFTMAHARAIFAALHREGLTFKWGRLGDNPHQLIQVSGVNERIIIMHKIPEVSTGFPAAGLKVAPGAKKPRADSKAQAAALRMVADALDAGTISLPAGGQANSQHAAIAELGKIAEAVYDMNSDETLIWGLRDNNPKN